LSGAIESTESANVPKLGAMFEKQQTPKIGGPKKMGVTPSKEDEHGWAEKMTGNLPKLWGGFN